MNNIVAWSRVALLVNALMGVVLKGDVELRMNVKRGIIIIIIIIVVVVVVIVVVVVHRGFWYELSWGLEWGWG